MLTRGLMVFHMSVAAMTKTPELVLEEAEAKGLSESTLTLLSLYDIRPDPKVEAFVMLVANIGTVYGTRYVAIRARHAREKDENMKSAKATIFNPDGGFAGNADVQFTPPDNPEWPIGNA